MASVPVITLTNAGDKVTLSVTSCGELPFGKYKEIEFVGKDADGHVAAVRVPKSSADRQLQRIDLTYATAVGRRITIKRDENKADPNKNYWGLYLEDAPANGNGTATAAAPAAMTRSAEHSAASGNGSTSVERREKLSASYKQVTLFVLEQIVPLYAEKKLTVTARDVAHITDSLFGPVTRG